MISSVKVCLLALLASQSSAHFLLNYPTTIGFSDDDEGTAPCGSFTPDFSKDTVTDFHVGGDAIAIQSTHPAAVWLFRGTLDQTAASNWTTLLPAISQDALGAFCEPNVTIPASWAGSKGIISIVQDAVDGLLYQCAAVNFVSGTAATVPSACTNVTGLTATFTTAAALSSIPATAAASSTASSTSSTASASSTKSAAGMVAPPSCSGMGAVVWIAMAGSASLLAFLL